MTDINVTVNSPTVEVIELSITEDVASSTLVTVATPTVQQINVSVADQTPEVVNVTVSDPSPEIVQVDVWESGQSGPGIIAGGLTGEVMTKQSDFDFDVQWSQNPYEYTTNAIANATANHILVSNPHTQYLLRAGGTITGQVTVPSPTVNNQIVGRGQNVTFGELILNGDLDMNGHINMGTYDVRTNGIDSTDTGPLYINSQSTTVFMDDNDLRMVVNPSNTDEVLRLYGPNPNEGGYISLWDDNDRKGYIGYPGGTTMYINNEDGYITYLAINGAAVQFQDINTGMQVEIEGPDTQSAGASWAAYCAGLIVRTRNDVAGTGDHAAMCLWTWRDTDRHVVPNVWYLGGDEMRMNNYENTGWVSIKASAFNLSSSVAFKERVRTARTERGILDYAVPGERKLAKEQHRKLRPVLFDDYQDMQETLRTFYCPVHDTREECVAAKVPGQPNDDGLCPDGQIVKSQHHCDEVDWCDGTALKPCYLIEKHIDRPGLIAEEVAEVYPKAISKLADGTIEGIDYAVLTVELINTVDYLIEENDEQQVKLDELEARLSALENSGPKK